MDITLKEIVVYFIDEMLKIDFPQSFGCESTVWNRLFLELAEIKEPNPSQYVSGTQIGFFQKWMEGKRDEGTNLKRQNIFKRDYFLNYFNILKASWSEDYLIKIPYKDLHIQYEIKFVQFIFE